MNYCQLFPEFQKRVIDWTPKEDVLQSALIRVEKSAIDWNPGRIVLQSAPFRGFRRELSTGHLRKMYYRELFSEDSEESYRLDT